MNKYTLRRMVGFSVGIILLVLAGMVFHPLVAPAGPKSVVSVSDMYLFFGLFALVIVNAMEVLYRSMPDKLGYLFLVATFIKLGFFMIAFLSKGLLEKPLTWSDKLAILLPLFVFLALEVVAIATRLSDTSSAIDERQETKSYSRQIKEKKNL